MSKTLSAIGIVVGSASAITRDDLLFILGLIVTIINAVIAYLDHKNNAKKKEDEAA